eukprot:CAMPEP_0116914720 /NCGR_PEP_ID=MMETSP0467-20121206/17498_1 /TAXON_ID=283647 /ORGANISM="Mesodinium pulex, Strain SPMC105" /LENGTH=40 /DNA_ID= /DNA_START= /DNA_END= /DNA_ORIENTATION=
MDVKLANNNIDQVMTITGWEEWSKSVQESHTETRKKTVYD